MGRAARPPATALTRPGATACDVIRAAISVVVVEIEIIGTVEIPLCFFQLA
jgi:hypothetical protein